MLVIVLLRAGKKFVLTRRSTQCWREVSALVLVDQSKAGAQGAHNLAE